MNKPLSKALWRINVKRKLVCKIEFGIEKLEGEIFKKWLQHRTLTMMDNATDTQDKQVKNIKLQRRGCLLQR